MTNAADAPRTKAVFFDLDDTLVLTSDAQELALDRIKGLLLQRAPKVDSGAVCRRWKELFRERPWDKTYQVPVLEWRAGLWLRALGEHGGEDQKQLSRDIQSVFDEVRYGNFRFEPEVQAVLAELHRQGLTSAIITNGHHEVQHKKLQACGAAELFPHAYVGGDRVLAGGREKPHPEIFHQACKDAGCSPREAIHVGDSLAADIAGGIAAGLAATVWVNRTRKELPPGAPQPTVQISHIRELPQVLAALPTLQGTQR